MGAKGDLAQRIVGQPGKFSGLENFLDVQQAFKLAQQQFSMQQQLSREQGFTTGAAGIINSSNLYGTDATPALQEFYQVTHNPASVMNPSKGVENIAGGSNVSGSTQPVISSIAPIGSSTPNISSMPNNSGRDEAFLSTLNPARQALIKQYADYRGDPARLRSQAGVALQAQVARYDPNFNAGTYSQQQNFINSNWNKGDLFKNRQAIENLVQHIDLLQTNFDKINNGQLIITNAAGNAAKIQLGNSQVTNALTDSKAVGTEMAKTLRGGGILNEQEQKDLQGQLAVASSPEQMHGVIQQMMHLAAPRINSALENYKAVMGKYPQNAFSPEAINAIKKVSPDIYNELAQKLGVQPVENIMSNQKKFFSDGKSNKNVNRVGKYTFQ